MTLALAALVTAFLVSLPVERATALRSAPGPSVASLPARFGFVMLLFLFWLGIFLRPALAGFAVVTTLAVMTAISVRKRQLVAEPLVFSDFGLLRLIVRHPDLYYLGFFADPRFIAAALVFLCGLGLWLWWEPTVLPWLGGIALAAAALAVVAALWWVARRPVFGEALRRLVPEPDIEPQVGRWGLLTTLAVHALRWRYETLRPFAATTPDEPAAGAPDLVVVVQLESFTDPARSGLPALPLPGLARARELARLHGPVAVPAHGAFTMRSEYGLLTGLSAAASGFRQYDPYLSSGGTTPRTLATDLGARGYRTLFIHPFRAGFFNRETVMPRLGFTEFLWEDDFPDAERVGPYVGDRALAARILAEAAHGRGRPQLIMAVTMENHGPWSAGRLADEPDPTRQYLRHLANSDAAIGDLVEGLSRWDGRALLCLFGDHPPILPLIDQSRPPETEYALLELGRGAAPAAPSYRPLAIDELGRILLGLSRGATVAAPTP